MCDKPIRVLQVMGIVESGGVEAVIMNYYRNIDKSKVQFDFVMHKGSNRKYIEDIKAMGGKVYEVTPYSNPISFVKDVYAIIKRENYKIVHSNMNALSVFPLFAAYLAGVPVRILHNHSTDTKAEPLRTFIKNLLKPFAKMFANKWCACSKLAGEWMYGQDAVEDGCVTVINNGIDLNKFTYKHKRRNKLREELMLKDNFVVGHFGRFMKQKNHEFLIDVFAELAKENPTAKLFLIGDGPLRESIENKVSQLNLTDKVIFAGVRSDVADLYNAMDVFVLPSFYEGLPVVGVEVQANGLPFICSKNVTKEILITDRVELLALNKGKKIWSNAVSKYIGRIRKKADQDMSNSGFDIRIEAERLLKFYEEVYLNH